MTNNAEDDLESPQKDLTTSDIPTLDDLTAAPTTISAPSQLHNNDRKPHPVISPPTNDECEMGEGDSIKDENMVYLIRCLSFGICHSSCLPLFSGYNLSPS